MTTPNVPTPNELIEQLRATHQQPFVSIKIPQTEVLPTQDGIASEETYERLRQEFDDSMRGAVSLTRLAAR